MTLLLPPYQILLRCCWNCLFVCLFVRLFAYLFVHFLCLFVYCFMYVLMHMHVCTWLDLMRHGTIKNTPTLTLTSFPSCGFIWNIKKKNWRECGWHTDLGRGSTGAFGRPMAREIFVHLSNAKNLLTADECFFESSASQINYWSGFNFPSVYLKHTVHILAMCRVKVWRSFYHAQHISLLCHSYPVSEQLILLSGFERGCFQKCSTAVSAA